MSLHYEVVFTCSLREDTPAPVLDALRWHLGLSEEPPQGYGEEDETRPTVFTFRDGAYDALKP
ncbi:hypothetical protein ACIQZN_10020 [Streptomyces sp. NPDC097595]|uniref:hypothetical protein n=1 Tax=Streptomyces sp. NPDC097595 TaxID=3366090 RepID=UPI00382F304E